MSNRHLRSLIEKRKVDGVIPDTVIDLIAEDRRVDPRELKAALEEHFPDELADPDPDETTFRVAEYRAMTYERRQEDDMLTCRPQDVSKYGRLVRETFEHIALIERLAETRALVGFHRHTPGICPPAALSVAPMNWRPAFRVQGEGIFLIVNREKTKGLAVGIDHRLDLLVERGKSYRLATLDVSRQLIFLHTLAHALIKRLSFEAGYGASSIRERVYSCTSDDSTYMSGILLYTAAGDADGTLGGLVGLGRPLALERVLAGALEDIRWCASDPICIESKGHGPGSLNLAACHACTLLPETSCELQNRLLDRKVVQQFFRPM